MRQLFLISTALFILWGLFSPFSAHGLEATAIVDKDTVTLEDSVILRVDVTGSKADVDISGIKDFKVVPRGSSSFTRMINGKIEKKVMYQYILMPKREGRLVIPPIRVSRDNDTVSTQPVYITVTKAAAEPGAARNLFAEARVTHTRLVAGQQAVYSLLFFTSQRLAGLGFERPPDFKGRFAKGFGKEKSYTRQINGRMYQVTQVDYLMVPSQSGTFTIDGAVLTADVVMESGRNAPFDSFFNDSFFRSRQTKPVRVSSNAVTLEVVPLPPYKGNHPFSGLIGRFDLESDIDTSSLKAGESLTVSIKVSGNGNIMDAGPPQMILDETAFKVYEDNPVESIRLTAAGYEGYKLFKRAIVPVKAGRFTLPEIHLAYYDVDQGDYHTISTRPIDLDVAPSQQIHTAAAPAPGTADVPAPAKQAVSLMNEDILEIKEGLHVLEDHQQLSPLFFMVCLIIPAGLFGFVKAAVLLRRKEITVASAMAKRAGGHIKRAEKLGPLGEGFWGHVYSALVVKILSLAERRGETLTRKEMQDILLQAGVDDAEIEAITRLFSTIESIRFAGRKKDEAEGRKILDRVRQTVKLLGIALLMWGGLAMMPQNGLATPAEQYLDAVKHYRQGAYHEAAAQFEMIARSPINNPYLFYNVGNAYLKAGDVGRAVLWYERARRLVPNDPDLRFNLAFANSRVKDKKEEVFNLFDIVFFWDTLVGVKTLQITGIAFSCIFFSWAGFRAVRQQPVFSGTGIALFSVFLIVSGVAVGGMVKQSSRQYAVIVAEQADIRSGVAETATNLFSLHAGTRVRVAENRPPYLKIVFSKDKIGWVRADQAEII